MEELAIKLRNKIDNICGSFHYYKNENVLSESQKLAEEMQQFCSVFLQGNIYGMEEDEYQAFKGYVLQVLKDYVEAQRQQDMVWMLDTLDYGLRELLNIYIDEDAQERENV